MAHDTITTSVANTAHTTPIRKFFGRNAAINIGLIVGSIVLAIYVSPWFLLAWPLVIVADDFAMMAFGRTLFNAEEAIQRGYQFPHVFYEGTSGHGRDLGFNLYDGNLDKSLEQAQTDKWEFMLSSLGLKPGDSLIDIGCGYGDWINYARSKGIRVTGVNISPEQASFAQQHYDLDIICSNWKDILEDEELRDRLFGKYDAVTFMDTVEHYVHAAVVRRGDLERVANTYTRMFELASKLISDDSRVGRVFISCLHWKCEDLRQLRRTRTLSQNFGAFLLIRFHSGSYPLGRDGLTQFSRQYFEEIDRFDRTEDYRITGVLDGNHFQDPNIKWTLKKIVMVPFMFLIDPFFIHKWADLKFDAWMQLYGEDYLSPNYDREKRAKTSLIVLWWIILKKRDIRVAPHADDAKATSNSEQ